MYVLQTGIEGGKVKDGSYRGVRVGGSTTKQQ